MNEVSSSPCVIYTYDSPLSLQYINETASSTGKTHSVVLPTTRWEDLLSRNVSASVDLYRINFFLLIVFEADVKTFAHNTGSFDGS